MSQPFFALVYEQDKEGKQSKLLTVDDNNAPMPMLLGVKGPTTEARIEAAEKMAIARLAKSEKYDPDKDNVPLVFLLPFRTPADLKKAQQK
jgi:hypothetical protein